MNLKTPNLNTSEAKNGLMDTLPWDQRFFSEKDGESGRELESQDETEWEEVISHSKSKKEKKKNKETSSGMVTRTRAKADCGSTKPCLGRKSEKWQREQGSLQDIADGIQMTIPEILQSPGKK